MHRVLRSRAYADGAVRQRSAVLNDGVVLSILRPSKPPGGVDSAAAGPLVDLALAGSEERTRQVSQRPSGIAEQVLSKHLGVRRTSPPHPYPRPRASDGRGSGALSAVALPRLAEPDPRLAKLGALT